MKTKTIRELTTEELRKVYDKNQQLRYDVLEDYIDCQMFWISEQLEYLKEGMCSWDIGFDNRNQHIRIGNFSEFLSGLENLQCDMAFFDEKDEKEFKRIQKEHNDFLYMDYPCNEEEDCKYAEAEENDEENQEILETMVLNQFNSFCDYDLQDIEDYFLEFYVEERLDEDVYIDTDTFIMYEDISYTKSYE